MAEHLCRNVLPGECVYTPVDSLRLDLRYALRALAARPGFSLLAVLTLAIGIGVNTVAFNALKGFVLHGFAIDDADSIGWIMSRAPGDPYGSLSLGELTDLQRSSRSFQTIVAEGRVPLSFRTEGGAIQAWGLLVSADYLRVVQAPVETGRLFTAADLDESELPVVVSHRFWIDQLGGGDSVAGRRITLNGRSFAVVGVLRDDFQGPGGLYTPDVWIPLDRMDVLTLPQTYRGQDADWLTVVGRLNPGVTSAQANAELKSVFAQFAESNPVANRQRSAGFFPMADGHPEVRGIAPAALGALAMVGLVLLIACFNVAGLLLARATERTREIGVRTALGASRARILRQMVTEGLVLAVLAGIASIVVAAWSAELLSTFSLPAPIPQRLPMEVDRRVLAFTGMLVLLAGFLPALAPAFQATRRNVFRALKVDTASGGGSRMRNAFVIAQVAGSTLFLAGAFLFVRSFVNARAFDPGFDTAHTLVLEFNPSTYGYDAPRTRALLPQVVERITAVPGVARVGVADRAPFFVGFPKGAEFSSDGTDCSVADCKRATVYAVEPGHLSVLGIPLRAGRDLTADDVRSGQAAVISAQMAALSWPGETAVGRTFRAWDDGRVYEVVGVAADIKHRSMSEAPPPCMYRPLRQEEYGDSLAIIVRGTGDPRALIAPIAAQVLALDPDLPARSAHTIAERMTLPLWPARTIAGFFLVCGTLALVLATVGLFGVTYYSVGQRTREFGIRMALGATRQGLVALVVRDGLRLAVPGIVCGVLAALAGGHAVARVLVGVTPANPLIFSMTAGVELAVALAACALPALRATRSDPMAALRQD